MMSYNEGRFPLSDITQLPTYGTNSVMQTKAFQKLLDSSVPLKNGKTFYQYEIADKGIHAWPLGATGPYALSTTGKALQNPGDMRGMPLRGGSMLHTIALQQLGATPVTMPNSQAYEALSRGTVNGLVSAIGDWKSYSFQELLKYTITGVSLGHWESYLSVSDVTWKGISTEDRQTWDRIAREIALQNAAGIDQQDIDVRQDAEKRGSTFVPIEALPDEMRVHIAQAAANTWIQWIETTEKNGHPAKATAKLWAELIQAEGGQLPDGVAQYLTK